MTTRTWSTAFLFAALLRIVSAAAVAAEATATAPASSPKGVTYGQLASLTAKVEAIDLEHRTVTVRGPRRNAVTLEVGEDVRNLPQVKVGDLVKVRYYESIALELKNGPAAPAATASGATGRAEEGQKPAGAGVARVEADVTVQNIDAKNMIVTVKGPKGNVFDVKARDPKRVAELKVGDVIHVTYTEALAVSVEEVAK